ncbi:MAG: cytidylate kinase-like family protein [Chloroflexota bacterium]|nr:cytidylate kinase-like family protein [Chloroflexota bacterium]
MAVVTLGGLWGGGSRILGPQISDLLGYEYVDRQILNKVASDLGTPVNIIETHEQRPKTFKEKLQDLIVHALEQSAISPIGNEPYLGSSMAPLLTDDYEHILSGSQHLDNVASKKAYFIAISSAIYELAANGNVVINGRGSHLILESDAQVLRVGIYAEVNDRLKTIQKLENVSESEALQMIETRDAARLSYFKEIFDVIEPDAPEHYDLMLNMSEINFDFAAEIVLKSVEAMNRGLIHRH